MNGAEALAAFCVRVTRRVLAEEAETGGSPSGVLTTVCATCKRVRTPEGWRFVPVLDGRDVAPMVDAYRQDHPDE